MCVARLAWEQEFDRQMQIEWRMPSTLKHSKTGLFTRVKYVQKQSSHWYYRWNTKKL